MEIQLRRPEVIKSDHEMLIRLNEYFSFRHCAVENPRRAIDMLNFGTLMCMSC